MAASSTTGTYVAPKYKSSHSPAFLAWFRTGILLLICTLAFCSRLFSVLKFESVIHEFDPWFNYRTTVREIHGD